MCSSIYKPNLYIGINQQQKPERYEVWKLANDESECERYKNKLNSKIDAISKSGTPFEEWCAMRNMI